MIPILSEDSPPSDFLMKALNLGRKQQKPNGVRRERGRRGRGGIGKKSKERGNRKEPKEDKDQSLDSDLEREGERGEIIEIREESSSISVSLVYIWRWRFQLEERKNPDTTSNFLREN